MKQAVMCSFTQLSARHKRAVILKSQGVIHKHIATRLREEFKVSCSSNTINQWFASGGLLEQALSEYNVQIAEVWFKEAQVAAKTYSLTAVNTIAELMQPNYHPGVRLAASKFIANRCLPREIKDSSSVSGKGELPDELIRELEKILNAAS